jgi:hypothetical protein
MNADNTHEYRGIEIIVTDWVAQFEYDGNPIRTNSLDTARRVIDCLIEYDARCAVVTPV